MKTLQALTVACCLIALSAVKGEGDETLPPPKIRARLQLPRSSKNAKFEADSTLAGIFGGDVFLIVENPLDVDIEGTYGVFINARCIQDGDEQALLTNDARATAPPGGGNFSLSDVATDNIALPCGPACLFVKVSFPAMTSGIARAGLVAHCDTTGVDLELASNVDKSAEHRVVLGEPLLDHIPALRVLVLKNIGVTDSPVRSVEIAQSVLVFARTHSITADDVESTLLSDCGGMDDMVMEKRRKRSVESETRSMWARKETLNREKRSSAYDEVTNMYDEWNSKRPGMARTRREDIPACLHKGFLDDDHVLMGGDIVLEDGIAASAEVEINLSNVKMEAKRSLCGYNTYVDGMTHRAEIFILADPLRLNNDSDLCNNAIAINVTFECPEIASNYDQARCDVYVDPLSRGHKAQIFMYGFSYLKYDGESMQMNDFCSGPEDILDVVELMRWRLLSDRYQHLANENPEMCMEVDEAEQSRERDFFVDKPEEQEEKDKTVRRKKRENNDRGKNGDDELANMLRLLQQIVSQGDDAKENEEQATDLVCRFKGIKLRLENIEVPDDHEIHCVYQQAKRKIEEIEREFIPFNPDCGARKDENGDNNNEDDDFFIDEDDVAEESFENIDEGDSRSDMMGEARDNFRRQKENEERAADGDFEDQLGYLVGEIENLNGSCPGARGKTAKGKARRSTQLAKLAEKVANTKLGDKEIDLLPNSTCGLRKLQEVLSRGGGFFVNHDVKSVRKPYTKIDGDIDRVRFAKHLNDVLEEGELETYEGIQREVEQRMNRTEEDEKARCGSDKMQAVMNQYEADDTYDVYWKMFEGRIFQGFRDMFSPDFGGDEQSNGKKMVMWKPVATCFCSSCDDRDMVTPGGNRFQTGAWWSSSTTESSTYSGWYSESSSSTPEAMDI